MVEFRICKDWIKTREEGNEVVVEIFGAPPSALFPIGRKFTDIVDLSSLKRKEVLEYLKANFDPDDFVNVDYEPSVDWRYN